MGTDESQFIHILTNRPDAHLRLVFKQYESRYGKKFSKVIIKEFSGWIETALVYLGKCALITSHFFNLFVFCSVMAELCILFVIDRAFVCYFGNTRLNLKTAKS